MDKNDLKLRTKDFALRVIKLIRALPRDPAARQIASQLMASGTSVGANYRSSLRGRSKAEWISKMNICLEEADECVYWLELIIEAKMIAKHLIEPLYKEAGELPAIFASAIKTARGRI